MYKTKMLHVAYWTTLKIQQAERKKKEYGENGNFKCVVKSNESADQEARITITRSRNPKRSKDPPKMRLCEPETKKKTTQKVGIQE